MNQTLAHADRSIVKSLVDDAHASFADGDSIRASKLFRQAILLDPALEIYEELARSAFAGPDYRQHLTSLHNLLNPTAYLEIGIASGKTLCLASDSCLVIGVDPLPRDGIVPPTRGSIYGVTSDEFFAEHANAALGASQFDLTFIDGLHLFEQVFRDFAHAESLSSRHGIIAIHDTIPLGNLQADRIRKSSHWCGDVWKIIPCLQALRPDLRIVTLPCYPSGLTLVSNLDPENALLSEDGCDAVHSFLPLPFEQFEEQLDDLLTMPNDLCFALESQLAHSVSDGDTFHGRRPNVKGGHR